MQSALFDPILGTMATFDAVPESVSSLRNHLLIAMPGLFDSAFAHSLIYICEHTPEGAMGLAVNRPLGENLSEILDQFNLQYPAPVGELPLLAGGPVQMGRGFVLHPTEPRQWQSTLAVGDGISLTASKDIIADIAEGKGPDIALVILGYAGWGAGQLEQELLDNLWLTLPAEPELLFGTPIEHRAAVAAARLGVELSQLSISAGHA